MPDSGLHRGEMGMKKLVFVLLVFVSPYVQGQSNNDLQRILGTWEGNFYGSSYSWPERFTFNSNGTYVRTSDMSNIPFSSRTDSSIEKGKYITSGTKIILKAEKSVYIVDFYFSSNGKILVLVTSPGGIFWLEKKED